MCDIMTQLHSIKLYPHGSFIGSFYCKPYIFPTTSNYEHSTTADYNLPILFLCSSMENLYTMESIGFINASNYCSFFRTVWISFCCEDDAYHRIRRDSDIELIESTFCHSSDYIRKWCFDKWEQNFCFWITKSDIVFYHFRSIFGLHQSKINYSLIVEPSSLYTINRWFYNSFFYVFHHSIVINTRMDKRSKGTHSSCVWTLISFKEFFMVLCSWKYFVIPGTIHESKHRKFHALYTFFNYHSFARVTIFSCKVFSQCLNGPFRIII